MYNCHRAARQVAQVEIPQHYYSKIGNQNHKTALRIETFLLNIWFRHVPLNIWVRPCTLNIWVEPFHLYILVAPSPRNIWVKHFTLNIWLNPFPLYIWISCSVSIIILNHTNYLKFSYSEMSPLNLFLFLDICIDIHGHVNRFRENGYIEIFTETGLIQMFY